MGPAGAYSKTAGALHRPRLSNLRQHTSHERVTLYFPNSGGGGGGLALCASAEPLQPGPAVHCNSGERPFEPQDKDGAEDSLVGTKVHVPYPTGVEVGTVIGVHWRKAGVVWVEYPGNPTLYEVARGLLFPSPEAAQEHLERVCKGVK